MELVFTGEFPPSKGGIGSYLHSRCQSPPPDGLRVLAAESCDCRAWDAVSGLDIRRFPYRHGTSLVRRIEQAWLARRALVRELRESRYRLVTANVLFPFGWVAAAKKPAGCRAAVFCHGTELLHARMSRLGSRVYADVRRNVDLFVANSRMTADVLVGHGCDPCRICVIPPPIDPSRFHPGIDGAAMRRRWTCDGAAGPVLLTVCRLSDVRKGVDTMFEVVARLRARFPELRYVVVGGGARPDYYGALCDRLGIQRNVLFAGSVSDEELPQCYAAADAFVLLSRNIPEEGDYEGFGIVYREAMACGRPVIVSREAGFRDYVVDGDDALVVDPRNLGEVVHAFTEILDHPEAAVRMGENAACSAARPTDWSPLNALAQG